MQKQQKSSDVSSRSRPVSGFRRLAVAIVGCLALCCSGCNTQPEAEETYPSRPIKLIVPFSSGGGTDTFARVFKGAIDQHGTLDQPMVVVNLSGAGATIGSRRVKDAVPDGYTVLILHEAIITAKYAGKVNYGPEAFEPVAQTGEIGTVIAVAEDSEYKNLTDLMTAAKETPDEVLFAANLGAPSHFTGLLLEKEMPGSAFRYTQYGGGSDRFGAIKGGHVATSAFSLAEYMGFKDAGLRAVAFMGKERHPEIPDIPTAIEQGFDLDGYNVMMWWVPKGTPQDRIDYLAAALKKTLETPDVQKKLAELQYESTYSTGEELQALVERLTDEVAQVQPRKPVGLPNIPLLIGVCAGAMAVVSGFQTWKARAVEGWSGKREGRLPVSRKLLVVIFLLAAYVAILSTEILHFAAATFLFVVLVTSLLIERGRGWLVIVAALAMILSLGVESVFSRFFQVILP